MKNGGKKRKMDDLEFSWFPLERWQSVYFSWGTLDHPFLYKDYFDGWYVILNFKLFTIQLSERP